MRVLGPKRVVDRRATNDGVYSDRARTGGGFPAVERARLVSDIYKRIGEIKRPGRTEMLAASLVTSINVPLTRGAVFVASLEAGRSARCFMSLSSLYCGTEDCLWWQILGK